MRLPVLLDGSESGVEDCPLDAITPYAIARGHQQISPGPSVVSDAARFMGVERGDSAIVFTGGRNAINEQVVIEDPFLRGQRKAQMLLVSRIHVEDGGQLGFFDVGHAMAVNRSVRENTLGMKISGLVVSRFGA